MVITICERDGTEEDWEYCRNVPIPTSGHRCKPNISAQLHKSTLPRTRPEGKLFALPLLVGDSWEVNCIVMLNIDICTVQQKYGINIIIFEFSCSEKTTTPTRI